MIVYVVAVWLTCCNTGTEHFQLYIEFHDATSIKRGRKLLGDVGHWEGRRGSQLEAIQYCSKLESRVSGPWQFGVPHPGQGARTDLAAVASLAQSGESLEAIARQAPSTFIKYHRGIERLCGLQEAPSFRDVKVFVFIGPPGTGKTSTVYEAYGHSNVYCLASEEPLWFNGYDRQRVLLIDDIARSLGSKAFLRYLDGHPLQLPVKGGFAVARYSVVCVCTNDEEEFPPATQRRVDTGGVFWLLKRRGEYRDLIEFLRGGGQRPGGYDRPDARGRAVRAVLPSFEAEDRDGQVRSGRGLLDLVQGRRA